MTQRIRNIDIAQQAVFTSNQVRGLAQSYGFGMASYKSATQSVANSAAFVNDTSIWTELPSGPSRITCILPLILVAAGGIKVQFVADQGLTVSSVALNAIFLLDATAPAVKPMGGLATPADGGVTNAWTSVLITGTVNVVNPGVLQLQWAQSASNASATQVLAGASLDTVQLTA